MRRQLPLLNAHIFLRLICLGIFLIILSSCNEDSLAPASEDDSLTGSDPITPGPPGPPTPSEPVWVRATKIYQGRSYEDYERENKNLIPAKTWQQNVRDLPTLQEFTEGIECFGDQKRNCLKDGQRLFSFDVDRLDFGPGDETRIISMELKLDLLTEALEKDRIVFCHINQARCRFLSVLSEGPSSEKKLPGSFKKEFSKNVVLLLDRRWEDSLRPLVQGKKYPYVFEAASSVVLNDLFGYRKDELQSFVFSSKDTIQRWGLHGRAQVFAPSLIITYEYLVRPTP